jgi:hypothetical protein
MSTNANISGAQAPSGPPVVNGRQTSGVDPMPQLDSDGYTPAAAESRIEEILKRRSGGNRSQDGRYAKAQQAAQNAAQGDGEGLDGETPVRARADASTGRETSQDDGWDDEDTGPAGISAGDDGDEGGQQLADDEGDEGGVGELEVVDFDYEGQQFRVPKPLVEGAMRQADYTRSKQEVATEKAAIAAERKVFTHRLAAMQELAPAIAQVQNVEQTIEAMRAKTPDPAVDPMGYIQFDKQLRDLEVGLQQLKTSVAQRGTELAAQEQAAKADLMRAGFQQIASAIPKWTDPQFRASVAQYAQQRGYTPEELSELTDPRIVTLLHDAMRFDRLRQGQPAVRKKIANAGPVVRPTGQTSQASNTRTEVDSLKARVKKTGSTKDAEAAMLALLRGSKGARARR